MPLSQFQPWVRDSRQRYLRPLLPSLLIALQCDAAQPACRTCAVKQTQCSYDPLQDRRKHGTYKRALEQSEGSRQLMSEIITIIRQYPPLDLQLVLDAIRSDRPLNEVVAYIHRNQNAACHAISAPALALSDQPREPQDNPAFATKINLPPLLQHREGFHVNHERTATP